MERYFEKPEAQVVRYRKRVKTDTEFTDSGGVQRYSLHCPLCNQLIFTVKVDDVVAADNDPALIPALRQRLEDAEYAHFKVCSNWPSDQPRPN